jgi:hypothetical protein
MPDPSERCATHRGVVFTIYSVPKPFRGHIGVIQENAIRSWTLLGGDHEIILMGAEKGTAEVADRLGVRHEPKIRRSKYGTPLMSSVFERAQLVATHDWLCYVNSDIILMGDLARAMRRITKLRRSVLVSGRRWRIEVDGALDFEPGWEARWRRHVRANGARDSLQCMDYFVFPRGLVRKFPKFALGRGRWDSYLPYRARASGALFVDATDSIMAVHQNHDYALPQGKVGNRSKAGMKVSPEGIWNRYLVPGEEKCTLGDADRKLTRWRLKRAIDHHRVRYWLWMNRHRPVVGFPVRKMCERHKVRVKALLVR